MENVQINNYPALQVTPQRGSEPVHNNGQPLGATVLDFWQWSVSDLVSNATRGIFAEFLVASILGLTQGVRNEWDAYDLETEQGVKVEVKSAAYLQSWEHARLSTIQFSIRPSRLLDKTTNKYGEELRRQADVYVFCLLHHTDKQTLDPLNIAQWTFYVVAASTLNAKFPKQQSVSLNRLLKVKHCVAAYDMLPAAIDEATVTANIHHPKQRVK